MFPKVWLSSKNASFQLKIRIGQKVIKEEMQRKLLEKKLRKKIRPVSIKLKSCLTISVYTILVQKL